MSARLKWHLPFYLAAGITTFTALVQLFRGDYVTAMTSAFTALVFALWCGQCHREFTRGWKRGFYEGRRVLIDLDRGEIPASLVREATTGDPAPMPWDVLDHYRTDDTATTGETP